LKQSEALAFAAALSVTACGAGSGAAVQAPSVSLDTNRCAVTPSSEGRELPVRRPDAVVIEPLPAMPAASSKAEASGVVALREPPSADAVGELVRELVDAWQRESLEGLVALLTADAGPIESRARGRGPLVEAWRQRLRAHEYRRIAGLKLVRPDRIERWTWEELGAPGAAASRPPDLRPGELLVRVPLETTHLGGEKLFEDVIVLALRREEGRYRIAGYGEVGAE
jgi:hypothetical protein